MNRIVDYGECVGSFVVTLCSCGVFAASLLAGATAASAASPATLANRSFAVAMRQQSVHYELHSSPGTGSVTTMVCDVGRRNGVQRITFSRGGRTGHVLIRVVGRTAYVRGDAFALNGYMGFRDAGSRRYARRWIKVPHSDRAYAPIAFAATLRTEIDHLRFVGVDPPILSGRIGGQPVRVVRGTRSGAPPDSALLYVRARGAPLPVAARVIAFSGATFTTRFSNWNEPIQISAPAHPVPINTTNLE
jgi:hypothetical protein